jgi:lipoprotein signal peptidase
VIVVVVLVGLDLGSRHWAFAYTQKHGGPEVELIPGFVNLVRVLNTGTFFGLFQDVTAQEAWQRPVVWLRVLGLAGLLFIVYRAGAGSGLRQLSVALVVAGGLGNLIDGLSSPDGATREFVQLYLGKGGMELPVFNLGDLFLVVGGVPLLFSLLSQFRSRGEAGQARQAV